MRRRHQVKNVNRPINRKIQFKAQSMAHTECSLRCRFEQQQNKL